MLATLRRLLRSILPRRAAAVLFSAYHFLVARIGSLLYGRAGREMLVIAVTGTKGKTSTTEFINAIFEAAGRKTVLINSIRIKIGEDSRRNETSNSTPGRFFIQRALARGLAQGCSAAILEMTSEGARQHRHRFLYLDALVFTNLAPEHIESHGSFEAYADAKFQIGRELARSPKRPRVLVANAEDRESARYLALPLEKAVPFALSASAPFDSDEHRGYFTFRLERITVGIGGKFSLQNALAAAALADAFGIEPKIIASGIERVRCIPGRMERVDAGQNFEVIVDYAYTPDSLAALLSTFKNKRKICVLGSAGGGRDKWKRPVMGRIAEEACDIVILTNDDPHDEDPLSIIRDIESGMSKKPEAIPDRRGAIRRALELARAGDVVLITGKGIDPIYGRRGAKIPWNDVDVAREELTRRYN